MKLPKMLMRYNPILRKHTKHKVVIVKKKTASSLTPGSKYRARKRGVARGNGNHGKYSRPPVMKRKMTGVKPTKKFDIAFECQESKKKHSRSCGIRAKRVELI